jgi:hypothetical protein
MSKRPDNGPTNWTAADVCEWLEKSIEAGKLGNLNEVDKADIILQFNDNGIDGEALQILPNDEREFCSLIKKSGTRIRLKAMINDLFQDFSSPKLQKLTQDQSAGDSVVKREIQPEVSMVFQTELDELMRAKCVQDKAINAIVSCASEISHELEPNDAMKSSVAEIKALVEMQDDLMYSTLVVVGDTGSGKSSLLNALLRESELLPTNGSGNACTGK